MSERDMSKFKRHMVKCPHCGKDVLDHMTECPFCHGELEGYSYRPLDPGKVRRIRIMLAIVILALAAMIFISNNL